MNRRREIKAGLVVAVLAIATFALAQKNARRVGFHVRAGIAQVDFSVKDLVNQKIAADLKSGLKGRLVVRVQTTNTKTRKVIHASTKTCSVTYNLWGQSYVIRTENRTFQSKKLASVLDKCLVFRKYPVAPANVRVDAMQVLVKAEFNPISDSKCRRLLRSTRRGQESVGPLVINIVQREVCKAERSISFRSQPLVSNARSSR